MFRKDRKWVQTVESSGPKCPWECPREYLQKSGCARKYLEKCPWGPDLKVSKKCLFRHF